MSAMICSLLFLCFFLQANAFLKEKSRREVRTGLLVSSLLNLGLLIIFAAGAQKLADKSTTSAIENVVLGIPKIYIYLYIAMARIIQYVKLQIRYQWDYAFMIQMVRFSL